MRRPVLGLVRVLARGVELLGDAEVEQLYGAFGRDENVRRLEVTMDDGVVVRVQHRLDRLRETAAGALRPATIVARSIR